MIHITLDLNPAIEPGHQWLKVKDTPEGRALAVLLTDNAPFLKGGPHGADLFIPHDHVVDQNIVKLINELAHVRYASPVMTQLTMVAGTPQQAPGGMPVTGFVYLIRTGNGLFKIGKTIHLNKRFRPFSVQFPLPWELVHSFQSRHYSAAETKLHKWFAEKRDTGEWFQLSAEDVDFIKSLKDFALDSED